MSPSLRHFLPALLLLPTVFSVACPPGFTLLNGNKCLKYFPNRLTHPEAETDCTFFGGTLVNIKNSIDNRAVSQFASSLGASSIWIGLYCFASQNVSTCYHDDYSGTATSYDNFASGFPLIDSGYGPCVYMSTSGTTSGQWINAKCNLTGMPFVCEVPTTNIDSCTHNFNGYCYIASHEMHLATENTTYVRAQSICQSNNANLVTIHSKREIDYIRSIYRGSQIARITIGAHASLPETFDWVDNTVWDFEYRDPMSEKTGDCMSMDVNGVGLWTEGSCGDYNYFLCKRPAGGSFATTEPNETQTKLKLPDVPDFSNCNSTLLIAPGFITSPNYPNNYPTCSCTYRLVTTGAYRIGFYIPDIQTGAGVFVYDENGKQIRSFYTYSGSLIAPSNEVTVEFEDTVRNANYRGFKATFYAV